MWYIHQIKLDNAILADGNDEQEYSLSRSTRIFLS